MLFNTPLRDQGTVLGICTFRNSLCFRRLASYNDVSSIEFTVQPSPFEEHFNGEEAAEDGGEDDEEKASTGVGTSAGRCQGPRVQRSGGRGEEDHFHC